MYHITGATMSVACLCTSIGQIGIVPDHMQNASLGLMGIMLAPSAIARIVNMLRERKG